MNEPGSLNWAKGRDPHSNMLPYMGRVRYFDWFTFSIFCCFILLACLSFFLSLLLPIYSRLLASHRVTWKSNTGIPSQLHCAKQGMHPIYMTWAHKYTLFSVQCKNEGYKLLQVLQGGQYKGCVSSLCAILYQLCNQLPFQWARRWIGPVFHHGARRLPVYDERSGLSAFEALRIMQ